MDCGGEMQNSTARVKHRAHRPTSNGPKQHLFIKVAAERRRRRGAAIIMQKCKFAIQSINRLTPIIKNILPVKAKFGG
jgi:hypothetical protein